MIPEDEAPVIFVDRVESINYVAPTPPSPFAGAGMAIDLATGTITATGLFVDGTSGDVAIRGDVTATEFALLDGAGDRVAELTMTPEATSWFTPDYGLQMQAPGGDWRGALAWTNDTIAPQIGLTLADPTNNYGDSTLLLFTNNAAPYAATSLIASWAEPGNQGYTELIQSVDPTDVIGRLVASKNGQVAQVAVTNDGTTPTVEVAGYLSGSIQSGRAVLNTDGAGNATVTFPQPFTDVPHVTATVHVTSAAYQGVQIQTVTTTGFVVRLFNAGTPIAGGTRAIYWRATLGA